MRRALTTEARDALLTFGDRVTPEQVVEAARAEDSPLHGYFTWDNDTAAERWRVAEARDLIVRVRVEVTTETFTLRNLPYFVHDPRTVKGYVALPSLPREDIPALLGEELDRVEAVLRRAQRLAEALGYREYVDRLLHDTASLRQRLETTATR